MTHTLTLSDIELRIIKQALQNTCSSITGECELPGLEGDNQSLYIELEAKINRC